MMALTMNTSFLAGLGEQYRWQLSLYALTGITVAGFAGRQLLSLLPAVKTAQQLNRETFDAKMIRPEYAANQKRTLRWGAFYLPVIFGLILPFCMTAQTAMLWRLPLDVLVILMAYDFVYYFVHRFLFHGTLLVRMHAIHHRQHNPCRQDSSYIHPLEVAIGLGLYAGTILLLSRFMGRFHVATIVVTWLAFTEINLHNHNRWSETRFPFKLLNYMSKMHHHHHARFTGGNFGTISALYDWMFGTLDDGERRATQAKA
jgi:sterol desaturase/sphingolipid hydroxylase (fatty acid hydroxylase superfamily)